MNGRSLSNLLPVDGPVDASIIIRLLNNIYLDVSGTADVWRSDDSVHDGCGRGIAVQ